MFWKFKMIIGARQCEVKPVNQVDYKRFCEENHRQGYAKATYSYGLYYNNELVQLMSFAKPRFNSWYQYEIIRDCSKRDYIIEGGTSKLWDFFIKGSNVSSCICYSYPHNEDSMYVNKYVDYCGFKNIRRAKLGKIVYFTGMWNGELKRIDKSLLERYGVDILLHGSFGHDRTNEEILTDLGFKKNIEDGINPQVDIYFPFGVVYRVDDLDSGLFYIGQTVNKIKWDNGYLGSGTLWNRYMYEHKDHNYQRSIILKAETPKEMFSREVDEIRKYSTYDGAKWKVDHDTGCMNIDTGTHGMNISICPECHGINGQHKRWCSQVEICPECGGVAGHHRGSCSKLEPCPECGSVNGRHKKFCSKAKRCPECGGINGMHLKTCSNAIICPECGCSNYNHKSWCSHAVRCPECGSTGGKHLKGCSKISVCEECGGVGGHHKKGCSKIKICPECGAADGAHLKSCSHYSHKSCPECGSTGGHKKTCSHYKAPDKCPECGGTFGHKHWCSKYRFDGVCKECGGVGYHKDTCSHRIKPCPECGGRGSHLRTCSQYKQQVCPECGGLNARHYKTCSRYKDNRKVCPECGSKTVHKQWCSRRRSK